MWKNSSYESICNICHRIDEEIESARRPIWDNSMDDEEEGDDNQEVSEDDMMNEHIDATPAKPLGKLRSLPKFKCTLYYLFSFSIKQFIPPKTKIRHTIK